MKPHRTILPAALGALVVALAMPDVMAGEEIPFDEARLFFELNHTDGDLGIHGMIDGEAWKALEIEDPYDNVQLDVMAFSRIARQGMTEFAFESAEPPFDELSPSHFFRRFPEGRYEISGIALDGQELESKVWLSHVMPAPPRNVRINGGLAPRNCDAALPSVGQPVVITWDPVTRSHPYIGRVGAVEVEAYQVFTELLEGDASFGLDLPPKVTRFHVPVELLRQGRVFKFEILVRAGNGNQTAVESCFKLR